MVSRRAWRAASSSSANLAPSLRKAHGPEFRAMRRELGEPNSPLAFVLVYNMLVTIRIERNNISIRRGSWSGKGLPDYYCSRRAGSGSRICIIATGRLHSADDQCNLSQSLVIFGCDIDGLGMKRMLMRCTPPVGMPSAKGEAVQDKGTR